MARSTIAKSLIDKLNKTKKTFVGGLPEASMDRLAKKFLLWTISTFPGPPVLTGRLRFSGRSFVGKKQVAANGPITEKHYKVNEPKNVITVAYSTPVSAGDDANVYYLFRGTRWFDYAEYQHKRNATNKLWLTVLETKRGVPKAIGREVDRLMRSIW